MCEPTRRVPESARPQAERGTIQGWMWMATADDSRQGQRRRRSGGPLRSSARIARGKELRLALSANWRANPGVDVLPTGRLLRHNLDRKGIEGKPPRGIQLALMGEGRNAGLQIGPSRTTPECNLPAPHCVLFLTAVAPCFY